MKIKHMIFKANNWADYLKKLLVTTKTEIKYFEEQSKIVKR